METALLKVKNDIMESVYNRKGVYLTLLDLSAAFDTVNHKILFSRLANDLGIRGNVLKWISSYLSKTESLLGSLNSSMAYHRGPSWVHSNLLSSLRQLGTF